jgi:hypothetical protein
MVDLLSIAKWTRALQSGTIAMSETNTELHKHELRNNTDKVLSKDFGTERTEYGTYSDKLETSNYKLGGTLCSALVPWAHIVCASGRDKTGCGRWTYLTYNAREGKKITVIYAYRAGKPTSGSKTASFQQETIQYAEEELIQFLVDPYKQTLIYLQYFVHEIQYQDLQHEVIVMIDANQDEDQQYCDQGHTAQYATSKHFNVDGSIDGSLHSFMGHCGLRNALREFHGGVLPNTQMRGSKQIDFILTTGGLTDIIEAIGLLDCSVINSNHCDLFIDLCIEEIFGPSPEKLAQPQYRNLKLDDPRISEEYRKILHKQLECHNIYHRVKKYQLRKSTTNGACRTRRLTSCWIGRSQRECYTQSACAPFGNNTRHHGHHQSARQRTPFDTAIHDLMLNYYLAYSDVEVE